MCIKALHLDSNAKMILLLDVWKVHVTSFAKYIEQQHKDTIKLIFVPPNCTSKLQPADVGLQRPFKSFIRQCFNVWGADVIRNQIEANQPVTTAAMFKVAVLKERAMIWSVKSAKGLTKEKVLTAWKEAVVGYYDVHSKEKRLRTVGEVARQEMKVVEHPEEKEVELAEENEDDYQTDEEEDRELQQEHHKQQE